MSSETSSTQLLSGKLTGSILMISGCCIGAGMISLPAITAVGGFLPSILFLFFIWAFMIATGLCLLEVNLLFPEKTNLLKMSQSTLGTVGKKVSGLLFLFLFFSLLIAYLSGTGILISDFLSIPSAWGNVVCAMLLIGVLIKGAIAVDWMNRVFTIGMIITYLALVFLGVKNIQTQNLRYFSLGTPILLSLPGLLISFGYQNLIPSISSYLKKNKKQIQLAIISGCSIPLIVYLFWEFVILGMLEQSHVKALAISGDKEFILHFLQKNIPSKHLFFFIQSFSLFALLTSLITVGLSFFDFLKEELVALNFRLNDFLIAFFIVLPPLVLSIIIPNLFLKGLSIAGGLGAVLLFGVIPVMMVWKIRYINQSASPHILKGGKASLTLLGLISIGIFMIELLHQLKFV